MNIEKKEVKVKGQVELKVIDANGNIVKEIKKENTDTLIAKFNLPTQNTLYLDLVMKNISDTYGQPFEKVAKTVIDEVDVLRSGKLSSAFSYDSTNKKYSITYTYTNTGTTKEHLYGLLTYTNYNNHNIIFTIFDLSDENIIIYPSYQIVGQYIITFEESTPDFTQSSHRSGTISDNNSCIIGSLVDKYVRDYKYTRKFIQTTLHYGYKDEVPQSVISANVSSSGDDSKAFGSQFSGEN